MPPEVYGALSLAVRTVNRIASTRCRTRYHEKKRQKRLQEKLQRHIARAERYQAGR